MGKSNTNNWENPDLCEECEKEEGTRVYGRSLVCDKCFKRLRKEGKKNGEKGQTL